MKPRPLFLLTATALTLAACSRLKERTIEFPYIETASSTAIDIDKVELTDSATIVTMHSYNRPGWWNRIAPESYLQVGDQHYPILSAEGIQLGEHLVHPASGDTVFTLLFKPVPLKTRSMDFLESEEEGDFKLFGIDLTGKVTAPENPAGIPRALLSRNTDVAYPTLRFERGETTVNLHYASFHKGLLAKGTLQVVNLFGGQETLTEPIDPATGTAVFKFIQYGPAVLFTQSVTVYANPGESLDVYIDLTANASRLRAKRDGREPEKAKACYEGELSILSYLNDTVTFPIQKEAYRRRDQQPEELVDMVLNDRKAANEAIEASDRTPLEKEVSILENTSTLCYPLLISVNEPSPALIGKVVREINFNDERLCLTGWTSLLTMLLQNYDHFLKKNNQSLEDFYPAGSFLGDLIKAKGFWTLAEKGAFTEKTSSEIDSAITRPFFRNMLKEVNDSTVAAKESSAFRQMVRRTPDVPASEVFDAIVKEYAGKVVLVDLWATWCGPCRAAIEQNEPCKDGKLKSDDLVWVYLSAPSSVMRDYIRMVPGIKGEHYLLNEEQWQHVHDQFRIDGIPSYVLVQKDGSYTLRNDFRNHDQLVSSVLEALAR